MSVELSFIPTRTESQAHEWGLVLASQGIEAAILPPSDQSGWRLAIAPHDYNRALQSLRLYRLENYRPPWHQTLPWSGLLWDARALFWCLAWSVLFAMDHSRWPFLTPAGRCDLELVQHGQWWRTLTAVTLHADLAHLAANLVAGGLLLGLAMAELGVGWASLAASLAGALANLAPLLFLDAPRRSLGASGMIMGALGLLTAQSILHFREPADRHTARMRGLAGGLCLLVLLGLDPQSDVLAHVAGFLWGGCLGIALHLLPTTRRRPTSANGLILALTIGLYFVVWTLALGAARPAPMPLP